MRPVDLDEQRPLALRSTITAADGTVLARLFKQNRALLPIARIPRSVIEAVLAAEDARFFKHPGYDLKAIARAALVNMREREVVQGGSTITQQYVKNTFFRHASKSLERKARELRLAIEVERRYSKTEILERYLNTVYFGNGAYGVKAAAETYFGHGAGTLSVTEAALLAALIKSPAHYDPRDHPRRAKKRRDYVLDRMEALGTISASERARGRASELGIVAEPPRIATRQPYFVTAVQREILDDRRLGRTINERDKMLWQGGLRVDTTLDLRLQRAAERAVSSILNRPGDPEAALVAIRPATGEIVAMVGGRDWGASQVNLALGKEGGGSGRQPGSAFKPIVAAAAMESGITLESRYESAPATFTFDNGASWTVRNAEGDDYGLLPLDEALVRSINGVYARVALQLGPGRVVTQAHLMGVRSRLPAYPSIALGSAEVSVVDMAAAYATLANGGTAIRPTTIERIRLPSGETLAPDQDRMEAAVSRGNAYLLTKVLEQVIERGTGTAAQLGRPAAGKTGTTNDYADAWFIGYTPQLVAAVWVGYPQGRIPMTSVHGIRVLGGTFPAMIWRAFMLEALEGVPARGFRVPRSEFVTVDIDPASGLLAAPWCPGEPTTMLRELVPTEVCPVPPPAPVPQVVPTPSPSPAEGDEKGRQPSPTPTQTSADESPAPEPSKKPSPAPTPEPSTKP